MQPLRLLKPLAIFLYCTLFFAACKKEKDADVGPDILFKTAIDGYTVTFTNTTEGASSYKWDFGDGVTSTEKSPVHTYPGKGKYVPTLTITTGDGKSFEGATVLRISKSSAVKLGDNSLADWDTVTHNVRISGAAGGIFRKMKLDYDAENVYFYIEMASKKTNGDIFDFYLDADNNPATGLVTWVSTGSGNDVLLEGAMLDNWFDVFYHKGAQNSFTFDVQSISDFYQVGTIQQEGDILKFEGKLVRSKIRFLSGKGLKLAVTVTKNDWSATLGMMPDPGTPALYLDMSE